jgi:hypothetical protein
MENKTPTHTPEPWIDEMFIAIKAGDNRLSFGLNKQPPLVDVRILTEENYQRAKECVNALAGIDNPKDWINEYKTMESFHRESSHTIRMQAKEIEQLKAERSAAIVEVCRLTDIVNQHLNNK